MTRFARAKGSKASNERVPDEATPWHVMKEQLLQKSDGQKEQQGKAKSAKELLKEKEDLFYYDKLGNVNTDWAEFEETPSKSKVSKTNIELNPSKNEKKSQNITGRRSLKLSPSEHEKHSAQNKEVSSTPNKKPSISDTNSDKTVSEIESTFNKQAESSKKLSQKRKITDDSKENLKDGKSNPEEVGTMPSKKKKKRHDGHNNNKKNICNVENNITECKVAEGKSGHSKITPKGTKRKRSKTTTNDIREAGIKNKNVNSRKSSEEAEDNSYNASQPGEHISDLTIPNSTELGNAVQNDKKPQCKLTKRQKRNLKKRKNSDITDDSTRTRNFNVGDNDWNNAVIFGKDKKSESNENENEQKVEFNKKIEKKPSNPLKHNKRPNEDFANHKKNRKAPKIRDDKEHKRRKPIPDGKKIIVNGIEIEIVMFDGFPVKKEDAERLKDLKQKMVIKGIPKSDIAAAMKLERRKAEKALARVRKFVCYHCRKSGHNLSDCPELGAEQAGTGICFKCGSTEHTHFECKVTRGAEYRHATCFICREQGHIAKQCPDNPKGVYPQGGACKICGDVTHLKKDCPDLAKQKEDSAITVDTITNSNLESLEREATDNQQKTEQKNLPTKVIKF